MATAAIDTVWIGRSPLQVDWFRPVDLAVALVALALLVPLIAAVALAVWFTSAGPVLFAHRRIGRHGKEFFCFKFRSMAVDADARLQALLAREPAARAEWHSTHKLQSDPRVTRIGAFLRRSSLDELPQLFNVLCGSMSLVGPRPIVVGEVVRYGTYFHDYCKVRPGITGLWQVSGRSNTSYRQRVAMDVLYVRRRSLRLNGMIIAKTLPAVMLQRGSC
jgi:exopolysaccharide production protein ExoY